MTNNNIDLDAFISAQRQPENLAGLPLTGIRVLELSTVVAAPYAAALLGDAGAEVIKIEPPGRPDGLRSWAVLPGDIQPFYAVLGRNKLPITLNLKSDQGRDLFLKLVRESDVLIENLRLGALDRLGLSHARLLETNPGLIIGNVSGYGMTGPHAGQPGFGTLAEAYSGFTHLNGNPELGPGCPPNALADFTTGVHLALAVSLALRAQLRGIKGGQVIDMSLYEPLFGYLGGEFLSGSLTGACPQPMGNELRAAAPRNLYRTRDKRWIALSCSSQQPWEALAKVMGREDLIHDARFASNGERIQPANRAALNDIIQTWLSQHTETSALALFRAHGLTAGPVLTLADIAEDPHYHARGSITRVQDPVSGEWLAMPQTPVRLQGNQCRVRFPGLPMGSANRVVYRDLLSLPASELSALAAAGTI